MNLENEPTETIGWRKGTDGLKVVCKSLSAIPGACMQVQDETRVSEMQLFYSISELQTSLWI